MRYLRQPAGRAEPRQLVRRQRRQMEENLLQDLLCDAFVIRHIHDMEVDEPAVIPVQLIHRRFIALRKASQQAVQLMIL